MRKRNSLQPLESDITSAIKKLLFSVGAFPVKIWGGAFSMKGVSDLIVCWQGKYVAVEVKRPGCRPTPDQVVFLDRVKRAGGIAFVAYSVDDVIRELKLGVTVYPLFHGRRE